jgi:HEAT repeat protein
MRFQERGSDSEPPLTTPSDFSPDALLADLLCGDDDRAEQAAQAIGAWGVAAFEIIQPLCADACADHRWWAARTLSQMRSEAAYQALIDLLADADAEVRACAAFALGETRIERAIEPLARLLGDSSVFVSATASDALARIGQIGVPTLIDRLRNGVGLERARAAKALLAILDARSIPALIAALDDDSPVVQHYASEALMRLGVGAVLIKPL